MDFSKLSVEDLDEFLTLFGIQQNNNPTQQASQLYSQLSLNPQIVYPLPIVDLYLATHYFGSRNQTATLEQIQSLTSKQIQTFAQVFQFNPSLNDQINKERIYRILKYLDLIQVESPKLKIVTFNLAGNVQTNQPHGSEKPLVELCQQYYPQYHGWSENPVFGKLILSQCTLNAVHWLAKHQPDLIGLQESISSYLPLIIDQLQKLTFRSYLSIGDETSRFIYDSNIFGKGILLSPPDMCILQKDRHIIIVWFPKVKLLAINLHAPHRINLRSIIEQTVNQIPISVIPARIIMMGDFNDGYHSPLTEIEILGYKLIQPSSPSFACCTDSQYRYPGDYIFDSHPSAKFYGIPDDAKNILMSDHHPVLYEEK